MTVREVSFLESPGNAPPAVVTESIRSNKEHSPLLDVKQLPDEASERIDITLPVPDDQKHLVAPAGVGGAVLGFIFGGPVLSALLGFGSAYAVRKDNCTGDAARALGQVTLSVKDKAAEIEDRHRYYERSVNAINRQCEKSQKGLAFKTRASVVSNWKALENYTRQKQLIERGVEGTGKGAEYVASVFTFRKKSEKDKEEEKVADASFRKANVTDASESDDSHN